MDIFNSLIKEGPVEIVDLLAFAAAVSAEEALEECLPVVGLVLEAVGVVATVAELATTAIDIALSPLVIPARITSTLSIGVTIKPDRGAYQFPASATQYRLIAHLTNTLKWDSGWLAFDASHFDRGRQVPRLHVHRHSSRRGGRSHGPVHLRHGLGRRLRDHGQGPQHRPEGQGPDRPRARDHGESRSSQPLHALPAPEEARHKARRRTLLDRDDGATGRHPGRPGRQWHRHPRGSHQCPDHVEHAPRAREQRRRARL